MSIFDPNLSKSWPSTLILAGLIVAAAALLMFRLDNPVLWNDEIFTSLYIRREFDFLLDLDRPAERHPPGHYVTLKGWSLLFGEGRAPVRSLSVAYALICLPMFYMALRQRIPAQVALLAVLFLLLFPGFINYGRQARMYAMLFVLLMGASLAYLWLHVAFDRLSQAARLALSAAFTLCLAATFYTHYIALIYFMCFGAATLAIAVTQGVWGWFRYAAVSLVVATVLILPQLYHMLTFVAPAADEWIPYTTGRVFYAMMSGAFDAPKWAKIILYPMYIYGFYRLWRIDRTLFIFVFCFLVIGPVLMAAIGTVRPLLLVRTLQPVTLFAPLLLALAVMRGPWPQRVVAGLFVVWCHVVTFADDFPATREPLFSEEAAQILTGIDPERERLFYLAHLTPEFELQHLKNPAFDRIDFDTFDGDVPRIEAHLQSCRESGGCGRTLLLLEDAPRFKKTQGARWIDYAQSLGAGKLAVIQGYSFYVIE